jgi:hypothetical protein
MNNWNGPVVEYKKMLSKVDWEDLEYEGRRGEC